MKNKFVSLLMLPVLAIAFASCAINPGADRFAVSSEVAAQTSFDLFDAFVHLERNNKALLAEYFGPQVNVAANKVRRNGRQYVTSALNLIDAYEANRTAENKANLATAIAVLQQLVSEAQYYMGATKERAPQLVASVPSQPAVIAKARALGVQ